MIARLAVLRRFSNAVTDCSLPHVNCWRCQKLLDCEHEKFFCGSCQSIQPPVKCVNYFQYLNQPVSYDLDVSTLAKYFRSLQQQLHPDRFTQRSVEEQDYSAQQASVVNKAYGTLSHPLSRALYLLELYGKPITEDGGQSMDPEFLGEMMELNEKLTRLQSQEDVKKMADETKATLNALKMDLSKAFDQEKNVDKAKRIVVRMKFYASLEEKANAMMGFG